MDRCRATTGQGRARPAATPARGHRWTSGPARLRRPAWPRAVLNQLAYSDLIPVIDGGIAIDPFADGNGMRNATWRSHVLRPGRPCMVCTRQLNPADVMLDQQGLFEDPEYIRQSGRQEPAPQNVPALAISPGASQLAQFVSLVVAPGARWGCGVRGGRRRAIGRGGGRVVGGCRRCGSRPWRGAGGWGCSRGGCRSRWSICRWLRWRRRMRSAALAERVDHHNVSAGRVNRRGCDS